MNEFEKLFIIFLLALIIFEIGLQVGIKRGKDIQEVDSIISYINTMEENNEYK